ncbi:hypothetical protein [Nannocystis sp.]|uniref:hypothetical protein n=1 Tax=Nannocystis sp. TaxID=1962667 RepID=UPI002425ED1B|nr:hypothetical protein [Nannocystis sp.]MBK7827105.1 hypothetical protein [Nannocystis sp.]MBK9754585.1 hypothetical protein [Nannocystis sp.]
MRLPLAACLAAALVTAPVHAAPPPGPDPTLAAFEQGFAEGQDLFDQGQHAAAARRWKVAADLLPEKTANRDQRASIYGYIADAYTRALESDTSLELLREASTVFDDYIAGYTRAYGTETAKDPKLTATQQDLAWRRVEAEAAASGTPREAPGPRPGPAPAPTPGEPAPRPWKPLVISGAVLVGVGGLSVLGGGLGVLQSAKHNREYNLDCMKGDTSPACTTLEQKGQDANKLAIGGFVSAAVLLAVGVPLLIVGMKRKQSAAAHRPTHSLVPGLGPTRVGLDYTLRF